MTLAICIACGTEKFGAFVPCQECRFEPTELADKAKSLMLSDHNFPPAELQKYSETLKSHEEVPYDFAALAVVARPIIEETYYWEHLNETRGVLQCMRCGTEFRPSRDGVLCALCYAQTEQPLSICVKCSLIFDSDAKHCQTCGAALRVNPNITVSTFAADMEIAIGRILGAKDVLAKSNVLADIRSKLSEEDRRTSKRELEIVAMYSAMLTLAKAVPSSTLRSRIRLEMAALYRQSFALRGAESETADSIRDHCLSRLDQYTEAMARDPERWMMWLGNEAAKNCFGIEKHLGAVMDMTIVIGFLIQVLQSGVIDSAIHR